MKEQSPKDAKRALENMNYSMKHKKSITNDGIRNSGLQLSEKRQAESKRIL